MDRVLLERGVEVEATVMGCGVEASGEGLQGTRYRVCDFTRVPEAEGTKRAFIVTFPVHCISTLKGKGGKNNWKLTV